MNRQQPQIGVVADRLRAAVRSRRPRSPRPAPADPAAGLPPVEPDPPLICWPLDHFYSPVPDNRALGREPDRSRVFPPTPRETPGIAWRPAGQLELLRRLAAQPPLEFPDGPTGDPRDYHAGSDMFSRLDAWALQAIVRHVAPRRMIEVGCGWSSLVTARVNREYLDGSLHFTCIEPYPPEFLKAGVPGISELIVSRVEELTLEPFLELGAGDILFIDTSHTVKTGGDVVFLFQEVVPRLAPGVLVHVHDMFMPWDYPEEWVRAGRAWNEQYLVRAFLAFNSAFEVLLGIAWMSHHHADVLADLLPGYPDRYRDGGGSLWIRRT